MGKDQGRSLTGRATSPSDLSPVGSSQSGIANAERVSDLELALGYAVSVMGKWEPGDSRAVSNEFVAMYSILCGLTNQECRDILTQAIEARRAASSVHAVGATDAPISQESDDANP